MGRHRRAHLSPEAREAWRANHPIRSSIPFLSLSCLLLSALVLVNSCTICYTAAIQGETLAFFQWKGVYHSAVVQAEEKASQILNTDYSFPEEATIRAAVAPKDRLEDLPGVTNSLMETIPELAHVYTLSVNGTMVGAAPSSDVIEQALRIVKAHYTTPDTLSIQVEGQVNLRYEYLPAKTPLCSPQELADRLLAPTLQTFPYTVQPGDTLEALLEKFAMTQQRLQELNPEADLTIQAMDMGIELAETSPHASMDPEAFAEIFAAEFGTPLEPGTVLTVEQLCPLLVISTVEEQKLTRTVAPSLETQPDATMFTGEQRIIQDGQVGEAAVLARVVKRCGVAVASTDLTSVTTKEAAPLIVGTGTQPMPELPEGMFLWPVRGRLTSDYGYRFIFGETNFHRGVDLAASAGTAINAAADGVVTFAGVKGTYGNLVVLSHGNGFQTYYAHCSQLLVAAGDEVTQGQPVAAVGSTGRSTGPHLHFEVRYMNAPIDPFLYLPGENNAPFREELTPEEEEEAPPESEPPTEEPAETPEETPAEPPAENPPQPPQEGGDSLPIPAPPEESDEPGAPDAPDTQPPAAPSPPPPESAAPPEASPAPKPEAPAEPEDTPSP